MPKQAPPEISTDAGSMASALATILCVYSPVSLDLARAVAAEGELRTLSPREVLSRLGSADRYEYFVFDGILQRTVLGQEGEDITTAFHAGGSVITPHFARTRKGHSLFTLEALTTAQVLQVHVERFDALRAQHDQLRQFGMRVVEHELLITMQGSTAFRERSARERLIDLRKAMPGLENRVPHTTIASYLGITPVSFSRLRNELARTA